MEILIGLAPTPPVAALLQGVRDDVRGGKALSQALDARREVFSRFYVNIVRAGEAGGALGVVLQRLAETMERNKELRENVRSALIYPTILIGVAVVSVIVLLVFVVPQFQQTFAQAGKALPLPTQVVVVRRHVPAQLVVGGARRSSCSSCCGSGGAAANPAVRRARDARLLRMPLLGDLIAKVEVARFARTLATLLGNGVTLLAGLAIVKETMGNVVLAERARRRHREAARGQGLRPPARRHRALSAARHADDPRRRGERAARGNAGARRRDLRPRGAARDQALPRGARARDDPRRSR